ncbi:MAG TPA: PEGA domain-containing protein [Polyangiaceae bacterium]|nr:PEGA domain-containing protein [Polyangiaceae bacterium]
MNRTTLGCVSIVLSAGLLSPALAQADPPTDAANADATEAARAHFNQGLRLYKDGDFDAALVQFERAYTAKPNYRVLYNVAQTYFQLRQYVESRDAMIQYLKEGGEAIERERRESVNRDLADLERRIAKVTILVNVNGAIVFVDGRKVGTTPLSEPVRVSEGQRTISIESPQRGTRQRLIRVAGGEEQSLTLTFEAPSVTPSVTPASLSPESGSQLSTGFWLTALGSVTLAAGAGVTGLLALRAQAENRDQRESWGASASSLQDSRDRAKALALTTDVLGGAAVICAGSAIYLYFSSTPRQEPAKLSVGLGPSSAELTGSF